jgi:hypothetical protein
LKTYKSFLPGLIISGLNIRHVGEVTVIDVSGRLTLGEGAGAIREEIGGLKAGGTMKSPAALPIMSFGRSRRIAEQ